MSLRLVSSLAFLTLTATASVVSAGRVAATATYCSDTADGTSIYQTRPNKKGAPFGLNVDDLTFGGEGSSDCYGTLTGALPAASLSFLGTPYALVAQSNKPTMGAVIDGIDFSVAATGRASGDWTLTWTDTDGDSLHDSPMYFDLIVGLQAGTKYTAYLFDDVLLTDAGSGMGTFNVPFKISKKIKPYLNVYAAYEGTTPPGATPPGTTPPGTTPPGTTPPGTTPPGTTPPGTTPPGTTPPGTTPPGTTPPGTTPFDDPPFDGPPIGGPPFDTPPFGAPPGTTQPYTAPYVEPSEADSPNRIPEPGSLVLLALGLAGMAAARRHRY